MNRVRSPTRNLVDKRPMWRGKRNARCYARPSSFSLESRSSVLVPKTMISPRPLRSLTSRRLPRWLNRNRRSPRQLPRRLQPHPAQLRRVPWRRPTLLRSRARAMLRAGSVAATSNSKSVRFRVRARSTAPRVLPVTRSLVCVCPAPRRNKTQHPPCLPDLAVGYSVVRSFAASTRSPTENS